MLVSNHPHFLLWKNRVVWLQSALFLCCYQDCIHTGAHTEASDVGVFGLCFRSCASLTWAEIYLLLPHKLSSLCPKMECGNGSFFSIFSGHLRCLTTFEKMSTRISFTHLHLKVWDYITHFTLIPPSGPNSKQMPAHIFQSYLNISAVGKEM